MENESEVGSSTGESITVNSETVAWIEWQQLTAREMVEANSGLHDELAVWPEVREASGIVQGSACAATRIMSSQEDEED